MFRALVVLGLMILVPAVIVFGRTREQSAVEQVVISELPPSSSKLVGASTLSHGHPAPLSSAALRTTSSLASDGVSTDR